MHDLLAEDVVVEPCLALGAKTDNTIFECKEGIVLTYADILAGEAGCATLTKDNLACKGLLTVIKFDSKVFRIGISAVFCCARSFLMCHSSGE
jgi:hypothetical protein